MAEQIIKIQLSEAAELRIMEAFCFIYRVWNEVLALEKLPAFSVEFFRHHMERCQGIPASTQHFPGAGAAFGMPVFPPVGSVGVLNPWSVDEKLPFHSLPG